jgi:hypothetical protein
VHKNEKRKNLKFQLHTFRLSRAERVEEGSEKENKEIALQDNTSSIKFLAFAKLFAFACEWGGGLEDSLVVLE